MRPRRIMLTSVLAILASLGLAATAQAAPVWNLDVHHNQTHFAPGGTGEYWLEVNNVGDTDTSGLIKLKLTLPTGVKRQSVRSALVDSGAEFNHGQVDWSCPGAPGDTSVTCTTTSKIARHSLSRNLVVSVSVAGAPGVRFASAKVEGGGAAKAATAIEPTQIDPEPAGFGVLPHTFVPDFFRADGLTVEREAGAHPDLAVFAFDFNSVDNPNESNSARKGESESVRNLIADTPPGFVGAPTAVAECDQAEFTLGKCPLASQVGRSDLTIDGLFPNYDFSAITVGVFNLSHPRGYVTDLGFTVAGNPVHIKVSLDPANRYAVRSEVSDVNETLPPLHQSLTLWGVPGDKRHDSERCPEFAGAIGPNGGGNTSKECSTNAEPKPFLTLPSQCDADNVMRLHHYDSWQNTGVFGPELTYTLPEKMTDCDRPRFEPEVEIVPTGKQANTPTGLDIHVKVAQNENPNALATPPVKRTVVTLPEGMSFSPSFADGLQSCTLAQMRLGTNEPVQCPPASRIGEVELSTPLLPKAAEGSMYLAAQGDNPFGSTFALLLVLQDTEERGALIKIPGRIDVDPTTGQITTVFDETPQFPFDELTLRFRSGPRAPLVNPPACGTHTIGVEISSYAQPQDPVDVSNTYEVSEGPNGTPCPPDAANRPFSPRFDAGTLNPVAGRYSTFLFRLAREDQEQELSQVTAVLPQGLVAKIAGVPFCPEARIAAISKDLGTGTGERDNPSCPAASQIGTLSAGLGAGPGPNYFPGKVYLAGPYKNAPLSLGVVAPGLAGPYDLGNVVVRAAVHVDPQTAQVKAISDPFPTILHGVLLRVRDIRLRVDRPETTINPTSCEQMSVGARITGVGGSLLTTADDSLFDAQSPFQVGSCASLDYKPRLDFRLFGGTKRGAHPRLRAVVRFPAGGANTAKASVALPRSEFLDQSHIGTVCTRVQFAADSCPAASIYGKVEAKTPLLEETVSGPIYLRSSDNLLPDLVAAFRGGRVDFNLIGRIDSVRGGIRNTFDFAPDVPVSWVKFDFLGGKKGLLINSRDLCKQTYRATAKFAAHNGDAVTLRPPMQSSCNKKGRKAKRSARSR